METLGKKKCLIYAHYYIPDVASTAQLISDVAEGLCDTVDVTVICTVPSYEGTVEPKYLTKRFYHEIINGVEVVRIRVPKFSKSDKKSRIKNIIQYFFGAIKATKCLCGRKYDYILTISQPPLLGGLLGVYGKKKLRDGMGRHPKLIYDIQDFNPEQIGVVGYFENRFILKLLMAIDKYSCLKSDLIITVGRDLIDTVRNRFSEGKIPKTVMINNWIDEKTIYPLPISHPAVLQFRKKYALENKFVIMYSGNIGLYYDLENLIKVCSKFRNSHTPEGLEVAFAFVGTGSVLDNLVMYVKKEKLKNIFFIPYQAKEDLIYSLNAGDVHWCVNAKGIKGVSCPSKYYGLAAVGKPILGVLEKGTEVRMLIEETQGGLVCDPGDYETIEHNIAWFIGHAGDTEIIEMGKRSRNYLAENLTKEISIKKYKEAILGLSGCV